MFLHRYAVAALLARFVAATVAPYGQMIPAEETVRLASNNLASWESLLQRDQAELQQMLGPGAAPALLSLPTAPDNSMPPRMLRGDAAAAGLPGPQAANPWLATAESLRLGAAGLSLGLQPAPRFAGLEGPGLLGVAEQPALLQQTRTLPAPVPASPEVSRDLGAGAAPLGPEARVDAGSLLRGARAEAQGAIPAGVLLRVDDHLCNPLCDINHGVCARRPDHPWGSGGSPACICQAPFAGPTCSEQDMDAVIATAATNRTRIQALLDAHYSFLPSLREGMLPRLQALLTLGRASILLAAFFALCWWIRADGHTIPGLCKSWSRRKRRNVGPSGFMKYSDVHLPKEELQKPLPKQPEPWAQSAQLQKLGSGKLDLARVPQVVKDDSDEEDLD